jgi:RNA polymerase subunit RPABC4/transcription elongation factor Spt4
MASTNAVPVDKRAPPHRSCCTAGETGSLAGHRRHRTKEGKLGIENCRECGKPVSTEAKTCPNCGARKPSKTTSKTRWGVIVLVVLAIGILSRGFSGSKSLNAQAAASPECQVKMANGVMAESRCDLMTLCMAHQKAGNEYSDILRRYKVSVRPSHLPPPT